MYTRQVKSTMRILKAHSLNLYNFVINHGQILPGGDRFRQLIDWLNMDLSVQY